MHIDAQFGDVFDLDNYTDFVSDAIDTIGDLGDEIGGILKTVAPAIAFFPGVGTGIAAAIYAAGAVAAKDPLEESIIGTVSSALPPGIPKIAFNGASNIVIAIANGNRVVEAAINACRDAARVAGPTAEAAFNAGISVVQGGKIDQRLLDSARDFALKNGGQTAAISFDTAVSLARGDTPDQVALEVARGYIRDTGGPVAASLFDTGVALAYGKKLQEAGYIGLKSLVKGNNPIEQATEFIEVMGRANASGMALDTVLKNQLVQDYMQAIGNQGLKALTVATSTLKPYTNAIAENMDILDFSPGDLAAQWGINEAIIRTAQSILRNGEYDKELMQQIYDAAMHEVYKARYAEAMKGKQTLEVNKEIYKRALGKPILTSSSTLSLSSIKANPMAISQSIKASAAYSPTVLLATTKKTNDGYAAKGAEQLNTDSRVAAGRKTYDDPDFRYGFDVAIGACTGMSLPGPGQTAIRNSLALPGGNEEMLTMGFDVGQALAHGITKQNLALNALNSVSTNPSIAAGQLAANGLAGSGSPPEQKAAVVNALIQNPVTRSGVESAITEKESFFTKFLKFFGLA